MDQRELEMLSKIHRLVVTEINKSIYIPQVQLVQAQRWPPWIPLPHQLPSTLLQFLQPQEDLLVVTSKKF